MHAGQPDPGPAAGPSVRTFLVVWAGQLVSVTGTALTGFALQVWIYLETGSVTRLALVSLAYALPAVLLSPFAGVLADRLDRRLAMLGADVLAGISTLAIAALYFTGSLEVWHIYLLSGLGAIGNTLQVPAWMAAVSLLVPKKHLGRANGLVMTSEAVSIVVAPAAAGGLLATLGLGQCCSPTPPPSWWLWPPWPSSASRTRSAPEWQRLHPSSTKWPRDGATCGSAAACWACC
jgi:DHA3 family macrolide efflux protein-like MFS transporter